MVRAAGGSRAAVFKAVRGGGCHTGAQLRTQLAYLATKSALIFDARGTYDGRAVLSPSEIEAVARRFEARWEPERRPKLGHTSHLLLSFPIGTGLEQVSAVAREVCEQFFQGEGARFDYLVAVHEDRAHRHAHVVLNRQSPDGEVFFLRSGHRFSYELFREAMVEHGERHGLYLEATERLDRGVLTYHANTPEAYRAREEGRAVVERERVGPALASAKRQVALAASTYRGLALEANGLELEETGEALVEAGAALRRGEAVVATREPGEAGVLDEMDRRWGYMGRAHTGPGTKESFAGLVQETAGVVRGMERGIAAAAPAERPGLELRLYEMLAGMEHLNPLGWATASLRAPAREEGLYGREGLARAKPVGLDDARVASQVEAALAGTGIVAAEVLERLKVGGAPNAALERAWLARDAQALDRALGGKAPGQGLGPATSRTAEGRDEPGLEGAALDQAAATERVLDALEAVQARLAEALVEGGLEVMKEQWDREAQAQRQAAMQARMQAEREAEVARRLAWAQEQARVQAREQALAAERERAAALERAQAAERERALAAEREQAAALAARQAQAELLVAVAERLRYETPHMVGFSFDTPQEARAFRAAVEHRVSPEQLAQLRLGLEVGMAGLADTRLDRLWLLKAYLETDGADHDTAAHRRVAVAIIHEQGDRKREREGHDLGWTH